MHVALHAVETCHQSQDITEEKKKHTPRGQIMK